MVIKITIRTLSLGNWPSQVEGSCGVQGDGACDGYGQVEDPPSSQAVGPEAETGLHGRGGGDEQDG